MQKYIFKSDSQTKQYIKEKDSLHGNVIEPFFNFHDVLNLSYTNIYHQRAIRLKAMILSTIDESNLNKFLPKGITQNAFLYQLIYNLELFGNAVIEKQNNTFYILPTQEFRYSKDGGILQVVNMKKIPLEGLVLKYSSPSSRYYGEPDYLSALNAILISNKADVYNINFFNNGAKPELAIIFENSEPNDEQIKAFKEFFGSNFKGVNNAHKTLLAYTNNLGDKDAKIRFEKLSDVVDMSFKELKNQMRNEIIASHGIPPRLVGVVESSHLGGSGELMSQLHQFNEITIKPKVEIIENFFNSNGVSLKLKPLDVTNFKDDGDIVTALVNNGIISVSEARNILGWQQNLKENV